MEVCKLEECLGACFEKTDYQAIFTFMSPVQQNLPRTPGQKAVTLAPKMAHTLPAKQHGLSVETEKKVGTPPQHLTKPCQRGTAASGEGTVPLLPSLVCFSPALHQEGRPMSSFGPTQSSRACSSSLVSNPKVFRTAGFVLCQAADKCGGWQRFGSVPNEALKTSSWGP